MVLIEEPGPLGTEQFYDTTAFIRLHQYANTYICFYMCIPMYVFQIFFWGQSNCMTPLRFVGDGIYMYKHTYIYVYIYIHIYV